MEMYQTAALLFLMPLEQLLGLYYSEGGAVVTRIASIIILKSYKDLSSVSPD